MLLRRVNEHVKDQNWFAVAVDFLIVVVGVFIGIQVANWNEIRKEHSQAAHYIERLDAEFDVIRARLEDGSDVFERSARSINFLIQTLRDYEADPERPLPSDEVLAQATRNITSGRVPAGAPAAFKEMVASGALQTLTSDDLRQALFAYDEFAAVARDGWRTIRDEHLVAGNKIFSLLDMRLAESFVGPEDEAFGNIDVIGFDREKFLQDGDIKGSLTILLSTQINQYGLVTLQLALAEEIEGLIQESRVP